MAANLQATYYRAADGSQPVDDFSHFPHSSQIDGDLRELRCHYGSTLYRVLYRRSKSLIILLHMFRKDTGVVPESDKKVARERWLDFQARMDAPRRTPPRAVGRDAP